MWIYSVNDATCIVPGLIKIGPQEKTIQGLQTVRRTTRDEESLIKLLAQGRQYEWILIGHGQLGRSVCTNLWNGENRLFIASMV